MTRVWYQVYLYLAAGWCALVGHRTRMIIDTEYPAILTYCPRCLGNGQFYSEPWDAVKALPMIEGRTN